jgi:hypothetical protein
VAKVDFEGAQNLAANFADKHLRAMTMMALAEWCLQNSPAPKKPAKVETRTAKPKTRRLFDQSFNLIELGLFHSSVSGQPDRSPSQQSVSSQRVAESFRFHCRQVPAHRRHIGTLESAGQGFCRILCRKICNGALR